MSSVEAESALSYFDFRFRLSAEFAYDACSPNCGAGLAEGLKKSSSSVLPLHDHRYHFGYERLDYFHPVEVDDVSSDLFGILADGRLRYSEDRRDLFLLQAVFFDELLRHQSFDRGHDGLDGNFAWKYQEDSPPVLG